jgi:NAD(P)-dependent dehydrogenase (short-subunit alcohol dehydrogenase family)
MDLQLANKSALVTGGSSGIGRSIARILAKEGVSVVVHGRNEARTEAVAEEIRVAGRRAGVAVGDLSTDEGAANVVEATRHLLNGAPDILVNNAGGGDAEPQSWDSVTIDHWHVSFETNLFSTVRLIRAFANEMKNKGWGRIINIATGWAVSPGNVMPEDSAAKAAMLNTTVSLHSNS